MSLPHLLRTDVALTGLRCFFLLRWELLAPFFRELPGNALDTLSTLLRRDFPFAHACGYLRFFLQQQPLSIVEGVLAVVIPVGQFPQDCLPEIFQLRLPFLGTLLTALRMSYISCQSVKHQSSSHLPSNVPSPVLRSNAVAPRKQTQLIKHKCSETCFWCSGQSHASFVSMCKGGYQGGVSQTIRDMSVLTDLKMKIEQVFLFSGFAQLT